MHHGQKNVNMNYFLPNTVAQLMLRIYDNIDVDSEI